MSHIIRRKDGTVRKGAEVDALLNKIEDLSVSEIIDTDRSQSLSQTLDDLSKKQDPINDLSTIRSGAAAGATAYQKPSSGIPASDLASAVQASLNKAETAIQQHQDISGKADKSDTYTKTDVDDIVDDLGTEINNVITKDVGYYASATELNTAIPNPTVGAIASVGPKFEVYRCTTAGIWTATGEYTRYTSEFVTSLPATPDTHTIYALQGQDSWTEQIYSNGSWVVLATHSGAVPTITIDETPTENSTNAIQSGGVYDALEDYHKDIYTSEQTLVTISGGDLIEIDKYIMGADGNIYTTTTAYHRIRYVAISKGQELRFVATLSAAQTVRVAIYASAPEAGSTPIQGTQIISETGTSFDITYRAQYDGYIAVYCYRLGTSTFTSTAFYLVKYYTKLQDYLDTIGGEFGTTQEIQLTLGGYIEADVSIGSEVDLTPISASNRRYAIVDCTNIDGIYIESAYGAQNNSTLQLYAFLDEENKLIRKCWDYNGDNSLNRLFNVLVTKPKGAVKCVLNAYNTNLNAYPDKYFTFIKPQKPVNRVSVKYFGAAGDGITNDSAAIQKALSCGASSIYIPKGIYNITRTLYIPTGVSIYGDGYNNSIIRFSLPDALSRFNYHSVNWRGGYLSPVIITEDGSTDITIDGIGVEGEGSVDNAKIVAFFIRNTSNCILRNCSTKNINYDYTSRIDVTTHVEWGMSVYIDHSENVIVDGGRFENGGYENLGTELCKHVVIQNAYFGDAWRVSVQIHQGSNDIVFRNNIIEQNCPMSQSILMMHGRPDGYYNNEDCRVQHIFIEGNYIYGRTNTGVNRRGGITNIYGNEHDVHITDNYIDVGFYAISDAGEGGGFAGIPNNWFITNNVINSLDRGIYFTRNKNIFICNNIIDSVSTPININATNYVVQKNILLGNTTKTIRGTEWED